MALKKLKKRWKGVGGIGEKLSQRLDRWLAAWEQSRLLSAYSRLRRRFSGPPVPGMPESSNLDPFVLMSVGIHLLIILLIYLLAHRAISLAERPPISVRILEAKAEAPAPAPKPKPVRQPEKRIAQKKPRPEPKPVPKTQPAPPKPVAEPKFTPKTLPRVAMAKPEVSKPLPKTVPKEILTDTPAPDRVLPEKGILPMPVKPFAAEPVPAGPPQDVPQTFTTPPPSAPAEAPTEIASLAAPTATATAPTTPSVPTEIGDTTVKGFQEPTGPVVVPERFLQAGRPNTTPGAAVDLIDTSDPDFTEYFELIKRRVYAAWRYPQRVRGVHKVALRFSLDRVGAAHGIEVLRSTNAELNASAAEAMDRASPFPPIPEKFRALVGQPLTLIFTVTIR